MKLFHSSLLSNG